MGIISAVISMAVGVPLGLLAGYYRGIAETLIMRCADEMCIRDRIEIMK